MARSDLGRRTSACPKVRNKATGPSVASGRRRDRGRGTWRRERRVTRCTGRIDTYRSYHAAWLPMWSNKRVKGRCAGRCVPRRHAGAFISEATKTAPRERRNRLRRVFWVKSAPPAERGKNVDCVPECMCQDRFYFAPFRPSPFPRGELTMVQKLRAPLGGTDLSPPFTAG